MWCGSRTRRSSSWLASRGLAAGRARTRGRGRRRARARIWKPQLAMLPALWFLLERRSVSLIAGGRHGLCACGLAHHRVRLHHVRRRRGCNRSRRIRRRTYASFGYQHSFGMQDLRTIRSTGVRNCAWKCSRFRRSGLLWWKRNFQFAREAGAGVGDLRHVPAGAGLRLVALAPLAGAVLARAKRSWTGLFAVPAIACLLLFVPLARRLAARRSAARPVARRHGGDHHGLADRGRSCVHRARRAPKRCGTGPKVAAACSGG